MKRLKDYVDKFVVNTTIGLFIVMTLIVFMQVIFRYVFRNSLTWSEEIARYMLVWIIFIGAGYVLGQGAHVNLDILFTRFPGKLRFILAKINAVLLLGFSFIIIRYGYELMTIGFKQKSSAMQIPMNYIYTVIPLGGLIIMFYCLYALFDKGEKE